MMEKEYIKPEFQVIHFTSDDVFVSDASEGPNETFIETEEDEDSGTATSLSLDR